MEILLLENLTADARGWLAERHEVDYRPELLLDPEGLRERLAAVAALVVPARLRVNSPLLEQAPRLVAIGRIHEGGDNIDFEACERRGIRVIQASSATARATAEYLLTVVLILLRSGNMLDLGDGVGGRARPGHEINDCTVGLFGLSMAGQILAPMLVALGARVIGYDPAIHRSAEVWARLGVQPVTLAQLLETAHVVSVQNVFASRYRGLIGERVLAACRPGQLWVSASRAALFDLDALARTLRAGRIAAFWLDSDDELLSQPDCPLAGVANLRITPRLAPRTQESQLRGSWYLVDRIHQTLQMADERGGWQGVPTEPIPLG